MTQSSLCVSQPGAAFPPLTSYRRPVLERSRHPPVSCFLGSILGKFGIFPRKRKQKKTCVQCVKACEEIYINLYRLHDEII